MEFAFTEEHDELRRMLRRFLDERSGEAAVRALMQTEEGFDPALWRQMAEQMGLPGLIVPESLGGVGMGPVELAIAMEEVGRALLCAPLFSSAVLAPACLLEAGTAAAREEILPGLASGQRRATLALAEPGAGWDPARTATRARQDAGAWHLEGRKIAVVDGHTADLLLVTARDDTGVGLFAVEGDAEGVDRRPVPTLDLTRKLATVDLANAPAVRVSGPGDAQPALARALALAATALAAEQTGGAQRCLEMSTEYAKTRLQFGRPIGSFQAVKHKCADMLVRVELARTAAYHAAFCLAGKAEDDPLLAASMAKAYCSEAFLEAAKETIQIHGGMGFTWEHPAHLYLKRARSSAALLGDPLEHRERVAEHLGI